MRYLLDDINSLIDRYSHHPNLHFSLIYILEAHAIDEWPIYALPLEYETTQHRTIEERITRANLLPKLFTIHPSVDIFVDNEHDIFIDVMCSWPFRYWILKNDTIVNKMMPEGYDISLTSLQDWLKKLFPNPSQESSSTQQHQIL